MLASVSRDEIGESSVKWLCKAVEKGLDKLVLDQTRVSDKNHLPELFQQLESSSSLRHLTIVSVNLASNPHVFESFLLYLKSATSLVGLKLQNNNFKSRHILKITEALAENRELQDCDLGFNKLCRKEQDTNTLILRNLAIFVHNDVNLRHLSLQGMHLSLAIEEETELVKKADTGGQSAKKAAGKEEKKGAKAKKEKGEPKKQEEAAEMPENSFESLIEVLADSNSLQCVHLSGNGFSGEQIGYIQNKFGIRTDGSSQHSKERVI